jgi:ArsR family transcriptional regulator
MVEVNEMKKSAGPDEADGRIDALSSRLKVLSEPTRLRVFDLLMGGVQCNCELGDALGIAPNLISHHLAALRRAGLVDIERDPLDARWAYYSVNCEALQELNDAFGAFFDPERIRPRRPNCGPVGTGAKTITDTR